MARQDTSSGGRLSVRLFGNLLITGIMSLILSLIALFFAQYRAVLVAVQLVCCGMVWSLLYSTAWDTGSKDRNRVAYGHVTENIWRGAVCCLIALIPWLAASAGLVLMKAGWLPYGYLAVYRLVQAPYLALNQVLLSTHATVGELPWIRIILSALLPFLSVPAAGFGYALGYKQTAVIRTLMFVRRKTQA